MLTDKLNNCNGELLMLAPMADLTHAGLRLLIDSYGGCDIFFTEMISSETFVNGTEFEKWYLESAPGADRLVYQLLGNNPSQIESLSSVLLEKNPAGLDLNMGCCAPFIRKKGWGVELMKDSCVSGALVKVMRDCAEKTARSSGSQRATVSAKIRLGEKPDKAGLLEFCKTLVDNGADFITLNPQSRKESRSRRGDWSYVDFLSQNLGVPVVGNGNIVDIPSYSYRKNNFQSSALMIGRGAIGKPWIFDMIRCFERGDESYSADLRQCFSIFMQLLREYQPEEFHETRLKRFLVYFTQNFKFGNSLLTSSLNISPVDEIEKNVYSYIDRNPDEVTKVETLKIR